MLSNHEQPRRVRIEMTGGTLARRLWGWQRGFSQADSQEGKSTQCQTGMNIWMLGVVLCLMRFWCRKRPRKAIQRGTQRHMNCCFNMITKTTYFSRVEVPLLQHVFYLTRKALQFGPFSLNCYGPTSSEATGVERLIQIQISRALLTRCRTCSIVG